MAYSPEQLSQFQFYEKAIEIKKVFDKRGGRYPLKLRLKSVDGDLLLQFRWAKEWDRPCRRVLARRNKEWDFPVSFEILEGRKRKPMWTEVVNSCGKQLDFAEIFAGNEA